MVTLTDLKSNRISPKRKRIIDFFESLDVTVVGNRCEYSIKNYICLIYCKDDFSLLIDFNIDMCNPKGLLASYFSLYYELKVMKYSYI